MEDLIQFPSIRYLRNIPDYGLAKCFPSEYRWVTLSSGERVKQTVNCGCGENWAINYILLLIIKIAIPWLWLVKKKLLFSTNSLAKMISDSLSSDSLISQSHLKLYFKSTNVNLVLNDHRKSVQTLKLWQMFLFFHNLAIPIRSVIILVILMMFLSLVQLLTELDSTQSYYLYLSGSRKRNPIVIDIFTYYVYLYYEIM